MMPVNAATLKISGGVVPRSDQSGIRGLNITDELLIRCWLQLESWLYSCTYWLQFRRKMNYFKPISYN